MKSLLVMWYIFVICFCFATVSSNDGSEIGTRSLILDSFIRRLQLDKWNNEEAPCLENILTLLENVKNSTLWATWIWNANSLPTGNLFGCWNNLGNFDQCMKPPWLVTHPQFRTKYCISKFSLSDNPKMVREFDPYWSTNDYINSKTVFGLETNRLIWGVCVPAVCNSPSIERITRAAYEFTNFGRIQPNITVDYCQVAGEKTEYTNEFYLFLTLIISLLLIVAASTFYRFYYKDSNDLTPDSLKNTISKSFCVVHNYRNLIKENKQEIQVMNGMRVITSWILVIVHGVLVMPFAGVYNMRDYDSDVLGWFSVFLHVDVVVDTFFAMSGLLHIKALLANTDKHQNLWMVLWKRYIRLIGPFALSIFYVTAVSPYAGSGPLWEMTNDLQGGKICYKSWKLSLLMINTDIKELCHVVTWYICCDYQLTILATVLFYFYRKDRRLGLAAFGTAAVFSLLIPGVLTYWYQLPAIHFMDVRKNSYDHRDSWEFTYTYTASYSRAGAYLVGVAMGYIMTMYKPAEYRNAISMTWSILGTAASLLVMMLVEGLGAFYIGREYYPLEYAVTAATNRVLWAVAVCSIIGFLEYGSVPLVNDIIGSSIFTPLSRLCYCLYLIHGLVIQRNMWTVRSALQYDKFSILPETVGTLIVSLGFSFVMWLLVEAPINNLCNELFFPKPKDGSKVLKQNGDRLNKKIKAKGL